MKIELEPGKYVVAVSGGVDSVVLLNVLSMQPGLDLIVAHFDHGIRENSSDDADFVKNLAQKYGFVFEHASERLGQHASEALSRHHRYKFLHSVRQKHHAKAILTAHHQDDVIETAWINIIRGTKYRGIYALRSRETVIRPLKYASKQEILEYAKQNNLDWREDTTNQQDTYLRNRIRKQKEKSVSPEDRVKIIKQFEHIEALGTEIENLSGEILSYIRIGNNIHRRKFIALPYVVSCEVFAEYLRANDVVFDQNTVERSVVGIKTKPPGKTLVLPGNKKLYITKEQISMHTN